MAAIVFVALTAVAGMHVAWGLGMNWPAADRAELLHLVVGATGRTKFPSPIQCFAAAGAIFIGAMSALVVADIVRPPVGTPRITALGLIMAAIFAARGAAAYTPVWRRRFAKQPFAWMDRNCYGPFLLLVAAVFALLTFNRAMV
jgi:hypothetical protein